MYRNIDLPKVPYWSCRLPARKDSIDPKTRIHAVLVVPSISHPSLARPRRRPSVRQSVTVEIIHLKIALHGH